MNSSRLEAFSDGVLAIIITIMVLELKVPEGGHIETLRPLIPKFISYIISFVYVGLYWNNHHHLFYAIKIVIEFFIHNIIGSGSYFRIYFTQHYLLTLWLSLPVLGLILIMYLNNIDLTMNLILLVFIMPLAFIALFSTIRSLMLWNGAWKHYLLYFFIYLCTFKIIPYLIITKLASSFWL